MDLAGDEGRLDLVVHGEALQHGLHGTALALPDGLLQLGLGPLLPDPGLGLLGDDAHHDRHGPGLGGDWLAGRPA